MGKENEPEIKMNFYSGMSMIMTLVSAASAVVSMLVAGRGFYYILQSLYDESQTSIEFLDEKLMEVNFHPFIRISLIIAGVALALQVILSIVGTTTAMNPKKKPMLPIAIMMVVFAVSAISLYLVGNAQTNDIADMFARVPQDKHMGLYNIYLYVLIGNLLCSTINLFGQMYGMKLFKKTGATC